MTLLELRKKIENDIKECTRFEKKSGRSGQYLDAIKLQGMVDAYKRVRWDIDRILASQKKNK